MHLLSERKFTTLEILWQGLLFGCAILTAAESPFELVFHRATSPFEVAVDIVIGLLFFCDVTFVQRGKILPKDSAFKLLSHKFHKTHGPFWVAVDILCVLPMEALVFSLGLHGIFRLLSLVRLMRLVKLAKIFNIFGQTTVLPTKTKISLISICVGLVIHWITCGWIYFHPLLAGEKVIDVYVKSLYWTVTTLTTIGYGDITPTTTTTRLFTMVIMILGVGIYGLVIGNVANMIQNANRHKERTKEKIEDLQTFMRHYDIPLKIQQDVYNFYDHIFTKRMSDNDAKIIAELPTPLQKELQSYMNMRLIANLRLFKYCSRACLKDVATALEQIYYSPGEFVVRTGDIGEEMFLIGHGGLEVTINGHSVAQLGEGQFFGEIALLKETVRTADVKATGFCHLYRLNKQDFLQIIKEHPDLRTSLENELTQRARESQEALSKQAA